MSSQLFQISKETDNTLPASAGSSQQGNPRLGPMQIEADDFVRFMESDNGISRLLETVQSPDFRGFTIMPRTQAPRPAAPAPGATLIPAPTSRPPVSTFSSLTPSTTPAPVVAPGWLAPSLAALVQSFSGTEPLTSESDHANDSDFEFDEWTDSWQRKAPKDQKYECLPLDQAFSMPRDHPAIQRALEENERQNLEREEREDAAHRRTHQQRGAKSEAYVPRASRPVAVAKRKRMKDEQSTIEAPLPPSKRSKQADFVKISEAQDVPQKHDDETLTAAESLIKLSRQIPGTSSKRKRMEDDVATLEGSTPSSKRARVHFEEQDTSEAPDNEMLEAAESLIQLSGQGPSLQHGPPTAPWEEPPVVPDGLAPPRNKKKSPKRKAQAQPEDTPPAKRPTKRPPKKKDATPAPTRRSSRLQSKQTPPPPPAPAPASVPAAAPVPAPVLNPPASAAAPAPAAPSPADDDVNTPLVTVHRTNGDTPRLIVRMRVGSANLSRLVR